MQLLALTAFVLYHPRGMPTMHTSADEVAVCVQLQDTNSVASVVHL